jgi:hypothetical protein
MAHGQNGVTNGVQNGANGVSKAKTLPKSFDSIEDTIAAFGMSHTHSTELDTCAVEKDLG